MEIVKISASALDEFLTCPKRYFWNRVKNIQPVERPEALDLGSAVHCGLAYIYTSLQNDRNVDVNDIFEANDRVCAFFKDLHDTIFTSETDDDEIPF